jgi:hypothetical protein
MKINDFIHRFPTCSITRRDGICRVRTFVGTNSRIVALLTDLGRENTSSSVTNCIEFLCKSLHSRGLVPAECDFIEHYERDAFSSDTFHVVTIDDSRWPHWDSIKQADVEALLGCGAQEFNVRTLDEPRLRNEIDRIRNEIDPFIDWPWPKDSAIIKRRNDIESRMISKKLVVDLVDRGASEQELQRLLKQDLSIFAEIYAHPEEEYICFSEFPVANGTVDFTVFSGRSGMDVTLIEVKGANFYLANQGHYDKFSSKIEEAVYQINKRLRHIYDGFEEFTAQVHRIRQNVEQGKSQYNSLLGPVGHLQVRSESGLNIRSVVIGSRTRNDLEESKKRYDVERNTQSPIKIESWDTWLRKVRRE